MWHLLILAKVFCLILVLVLTTFTTYNFELIIYEVSIELTIYITYIKQLKKYYYQFMITWLLTKILYVFNNFG